MNDTMKAIYIHERQGHNGTVKFFFDRITVYGFNGVSYLSQNIREFRIRYKYERKDWGSLFDND